jgi:two-component system, chemotaxis family, CheB/CheR fusion protein
MTYGQERIDDPAAPGSGAGRERELDALLDYLHRERGFDFTGHKRPGITRRIHRRMAAAGVSSIGDYIHYLEQSPEELAQLFDVLLINVTAFFRDAAAWDALAARLPTIIDLRAETPVRVWSAGCSSGEEPYTMAMVLREVLGAEAFARRVKIYATDIDEDALGLARAGIYSGKAIEAVPAALVNKYFTPTASGFAFDKEIRREVIFGRHDLLRDAPIPRIDVLSCRNALMYFNAETQERVVERLRFAINPSGVLFLGRAEMLLSHSRLFTPIDLKLRLYAPTPSAAQMRASHVAPIEDPRVVLDVDSRMRLRTTAFDTSATAQLVVDSNGRVLLTNRKAVQLFALADEATGWSITELELSSRGGDLHSSIESARRERRVIRIREIERAYPTGEKAFLDVEITPVDEGGVPAALLSFVDVTDARRLRTELRRANLELEATQDELRSMRRELELTNKELQATNEELETTNEELQATNQELEATNEELEATNEELQTINEELRKRGTELNEASSLLVTVLGTLPRGVVVLDRELRVIVWSNRMTELFGLSAPEACGQHFAKLDIGLRLDDLEAPLRAALEARDECERTLDGTTRDGKNVVCEVRIAPLRGDHTKGVIVLVGEVR